eukprot:6324444-Pyramimonas_sp.AAC.1
MNMMMLMMMVRRRRKRRWGPEKANTPLRMWGITLTVRPNMETFRTNIEVILISFLCEYGGFLPV